MFRFFNTLVSAFYLLQIASSAYIGKTTIRQSGAGRVPSIHFDPCRSKEVGKFVKDRYDCHKFFYCAPDGVGISVDCPYGMVFNDQKGICDFPSNYFCIPEKKDEERFELETTLADVVVTTIATVPVTDAAANIDDIDYVCPTNDNGSLIFLPDSNECHRYYLCYHGSPIAQECIKELHWNQKMQRCDFPENAGCLVTTTTTTPTTTTTTTTTTSVASVGGSVKCPFRGEQILPHPEHCSYFIYCVNGYATVQQCPFFHYYDVPSRSCKWRTLAKCITNKE